MTKLIKISKLSDNSFLWPVLLFQESFPVLRPEGARMKRLCGLDVDRLDRFSMVVREDIALDTFGQEEDLDDTKGDFMIPRKVERRGKPR